MIQIFDHSKNVHPFNTSKFMHYGPIASSGKPHNTHKARYNNERSTTGSQSFQKLLTLTVLSSYLKDNF
jgi:hypothetical protein